MTKYKATLNLHKATKVPAKIKAKCKTFTDTWDQFSDLRTIEVTGKKKHLKKYFSKLNKVKI